VLDILKSCVFACSKIVLLFVDGIGG
jgi:hypothetical protein